MKFFVVGLLCGLSFLHAENNNKVSNSAPDLTVNKQLCPCGCGCKGPCKCGCMEGKTCTCRVKEFDTSDGQMNHF